MTCRYIANSWFHSACRGLKNRKTTMPDVLTETLRSWQNFYFMIGGAAAALVGLMFVAMSLGMPYVTDVNREDLHIFVTPSIFYFVSVLLMACVMLVPTYTPMLFTLIVLLGGAVGLFWSLQYVRRLMRAANEHQDFNAMDWLTQILLPLAGYGVIIAAGVGLFIQQEPPAFMGLWLASILLLIVGLTNTWNLVLWILEQRKS
jgi:hypothetical protein